MPRLALLLLAACAAPQEPQSNTLGPPSTAAPVAADSDPDEQICKEEPSTGTSCAAPCAAREPRWSESAARPRTCTGRATTFTRGTSASDRPQRAPALARRAARPLVRPRAGCAAVAEICGGEEPTSPAGGLRCGSVRGSRGSAPADRYRLAWTTGAGALAAFEPSPGELLPLKRRFTRGAVLDLPRGRDARRVDRASLPRLRGSALLVPASPDLDRALARRRVVVEVSELRVLAGDLAEREHRDVADARVRVPHPRQERGTAPSPSAISGRASVCSIERARPARRGVGSASHPPARDPEARPAPARAPGTPHRPIPSCDLLRWSACSHRAAHPDNPQAPRRA